MPYRKDSRRLHRRDDPPALPTCRNAMERGAGRFREVAFLQPPAAESHPIFSLIRSARSRSLFLPPSPRPSSKRLRKCPPLRSFDQGCRNPVPSVML